MDKFIINILKKIEKNGYEAYVVGGYVRNKILGITSRDVDICTNALPKDIIKIFNLKKDTKNNYGSVNIVTKKYNIDITTYRKESTYIDHKPIDLEFVVNIEEDLNRRDFTINSILLTSNNKIIDKYNGVNDLNNKILKCIGNTKTKLKTDPLRILRGIRFSVVYNLEIDKEIINFIKSNKELIKNISYFRKKEELDKIFTSKNKLKGLKLLKELKLLDVLEIKYDNIIDVNDINGIYAQIEFNDSYPFNKETKKIVSDIKNIINLKTVNNYTLYKYGLYINSIAGKILGIEYNRINAMYNKLSIKNKKDIKISYKSIVKLNNNCYNNINDLIKNIEKNILDGKLKNKTKDIVKFIRK